MFVVVGSVCAAVEGRGSEGWEDVVVVGWVVGEMGKSALMERSVSAATMPPMLCPISIVWTEGSTVGEG